MSDFDSGVGTASSDGGSTNSLVVPPWSLPEYVDESIAIVGIACRFSQANSPSKLWEMIKSGKTGHTTVPERSWSPRTWYHPSRQRAGGICATSGHFLDNVSSFDAPFFSLTASEAAAMDPMQRLGLEIAYQAFENAGFTMQMLAKSTTAVYAGAMTNDYQMLSESDPYHLGVNSAAGTGKSMLSNRISWFFDLHGPSVTIDTACSSSLYAVHLACQSIRMRESDQALVTGHNLILNPTLFSQLSAMHMVSPDGISHSFDASANGYGRGEGVAGLVLKRLSSAVADGDVIRAVIRASGVNSDGKTPGITVPSKDAQVELIRRVYKGADLDMSSTAYFEAHGTGTPQGDPIEVQAISATVAAARQSRGAGPLYVGSVKPNIGHTEGCAGLAGVIKTVLCLESGVIPPIAGLLKIKPELIEQGSGLIFPTAAIPWPTKGLRRASVNSFGFGGANAHIVLDDAPHCLDEMKRQGRHFTRSHDETVCETPLAAKASKETGYGQLLFVLSAFDRKGLERNARALRTFLEEHGVVSLTSLAHILASRRTAHSFRTFVVAGTREELAARLLSDKDHPVPLPGIRTSQKRQLVFLFTGQGAQRPGMAKELLASCSVFRESIARSQKYLQRLGCEWALADMLARAGAEVLNDAKYSQPICTALQIALVQCLSHWGVVPSAVIGHSSGELAAAFAAGAVSHEDAMRVAYYRGLLSTKVSHLVGRPGGMLAVGLSEKEISRFLAENRLEDEITIACVNSPGSVTLSGPLTAISLAEEALRKGQHFCRSLRTGGVAYHSLDMNVIADEFVRCMGPLQSPHNRCLQVKMYSSITELPVADARSLTAEYWHLNMVSPVRFAGALHNLLSSQDLGMHGDLSGLQHCTVLEIGPAKTLAGPVGDIMKKIDASVRPETIPYLSMLGAGEDSWLSTLNAAGLLWSVGVPIDLDKVHDLNSAPQELQISELPILPSYAWDHGRSYWHDAKPALVGFRGNTTPRIDLLGVPVLPHNPFEPAWRNVLRSNELPWLADHIVDGVALFPAAGYLVMAIEAVRGLARDRNRSLHGIELLNVMFENGLMVSKDIEDKNQKGQDVTLTMRPDADDAWVYEFAVYAVPSSDEEWRRLAKGTVIGHVADKTAEGGPATFEKQERERKWRDEQRPHLQAIDKLAQKYIDVEAFYAYLASIGLEYGPAFQGLKTIRCAMSNEPHGHGRAFGECIVPDSRSVMPEFHEHDYLIHPATLDSLFQLVFAALQSGSHAEMKMAAIPTSAQRVFIADSLPRRSGTRLAAVAVSKQHAGSMSADLTVCDADFDRPAVLVEDIVLRRITSPPNLDGSRSMVNTESSTFHRTGVIVWKEDIDQPVDRWRDRVLEKSTLTEKSAFILDRFCHKRAHAKVLCLGFKNHWDILLGQTNGGAFSSLPSVRLEDCMSFESLQDWKKTWKGENQKSSEKSGSNKYNIVFLNSSVFNKEHSGQAYSTRGDWIQSALAEMCVADAWLIITSDHSSEAAKIEQFWGNLARLSSLSIILLSNSSVDLLPGYNIDPVGQPSTLAADTAIKYGIQRLLPEVSQDGIMVIGPATDSQSSQMDAASRVGIRNLLLDTLSSLGIGAHYIPFDKAMAAHEISKERPIISLVEFGIPFVYDWSEEDFERFRTLISSASCVIWLTAGGFLSPISETMVQYAPTVGLLRTVRVEFPDLTIPLLDISTATSQDQPERAVNLILEVLQRNLIHIKQEKAGDTQYTHDRMMPESEYSELNGNLFIPRVLAHAESDRYIANSTSLHQKSHLIPISEGGIHTVALSTRDIPQLWVKDLEGDKHAYWVLQDHQGNSHQERSLAKTPSIQGAAFIKLQHAVSHTTDMAETNAAGQFVALVCGHTVGVVENMTGTQKKDIFGSLVSPGDLVFTFTQQPLQPVFFQEVESCVRLPNSLHQVSASLTYWLGPLSIAFYLLSETAHLSWGDSLLIDLGDNIVLERALLQVMECLGAGQVFVIASEQYPELHPSFEGSTVRLPRLSLTLARSIRSATGGINVVISTSSSVENIRRLAMVMADDCRVIFDNRSSHIRAFGDSVLPDRHIRHLDLKDTTIFDLKHSLSLQRALLTTLRQIESGRLALAQPLRQLSAANTAVFAKTYTSKLLLLPGHREISRILLSISASDAAVFYRLHQASTPSSTEPNRKDTPILDPKGTYIISGGLGALGLPLAKMICDFGARRLILLSRSGKPTSPGAVSVLENLKKKGCHVEVTQCDITSKTDIEMLADRLERLPGFRLRGVIQSAMVLADSTLSNMNMDQWRAATTPKIQGSWNLHKLSARLSKDRVGGPMKGGQTLDFFILMSSVSGVIGNSAQANYCAGNTFEDALAHYRRNNGLPATSLNIGLVSDSDHFGKGTMKRYGNVDEYLAIFSHLRPVTVTTEEVLAGVKMILAAPFSRSKDTHLVSWSPPIQLIVGISDRIRRQEDMLNNWPMDRKFDHRAAASVMRGSGQEMTRRKSRRHEIYEILSTAKDFGQATRYVEEFMKEKVSQATGIEISSVEPERSLVTYGIDSLKATEIRNWVKKTFKCDISVFDILSPASISALSMTISARSNIFERFRNQ